jgi:hypothetical protein
VTVLVAAGNLAAVGVCWLAAGGHIGATQDVPPVARDVLSVQSVTPEVTLREDGATYVVHLRVPSTDALQGRIVWAANVKEKVDRGLGEIPAAAYADTPCYQASGIDWECEPLHLGQCQELLGGGALGNYHVYVLLLTAREIHQLRTNQIANGGAIPIGTAQALGPMNVTPPHDVPTECPRRQ